MNPRLLISTLGGPPEPIVVGVLQSGPARVVFIVTLQPRESLARDILPKLDDAGWGEFDAERCDLREIAANEADLPSPLFFPT